MGHKPLPICRWADWLQSRLPAGTDSADKRKLPGKPLNKHHSEVLTFADTDPSALAGLLHCYGMQIELLEDGQVIPGSFWGDEEAGLKANKLILRADTPLHSALHEACHYICMDETRRAGLDTNAGGDYDEENAVCYLQILLAAHLPGFGSARMLQDMDDWGYSFRLGSARAWFEQDAADARQTLLDWQLIDQQHQATFSLRGQPKNPKKTPSESPAKEP